MPYIVIVQINLVYPCKAFNSAWYTVNPPQVLVIIVIVVVMVIIKRYSSWTGLCENCNIRCGKL